MARLRVREIAEQQGLNISQLSRRADVNIGTTRRYWYGTRDGRADGEPLEEISLMALKAFAGVLGVASRDLLTEEDRLTLRLIGV